MTRTRLRAPLAPTAAKVSPSATTVAVLPTPPFILATAIVLAPMPPTIPLRRRYCRASNTLDAPLRTHAQIYLACAGHPSPPSFHLRRSDQKGSDIWTALRLIALPSP